MSETLMCQCGKECGDHVPEQMSRRERIATALAAAAFANFGGSAKAHWSHFISEVLEFTDLLIAELDKGEG